MLNIILKHVVNVVVDGQHVGFKSVYMHCSKYMQVCILLLLFKAVKNDDSTNTDIFYDYIVDKSRRTVLSSVPNFTLISIYCRHCGAKIACQNTSLLPPALSTEGSFEVFHPYRYRIPKTDRDKKFYYNLTKFAASVVSWCIRC